MYVLELWANLELQKWAIIKMWPCNHKVWYIKSLQLKYHVYIYIRMYMFIWMYIQQTWKGSIFLKTQLKRMEFDIFFNFNLSRAASCNIPIHSCLALVSWKDTMTDSTMRWRIRQATLLFAKKNIWVSMLRGHSREFKVQCHHETNKQTNKTSLNEISGNLLHFKSTQKGPNVPFSQKNIDASKTLADLRIDASRFIQDSESIRHSCYRSLQRHPWRHHGTYRPTVFRWVMYP